MHNHEWAAIPVIDMHLWYECNVCHQLEDAVALMQSADNFAQIQAAFLRMHGGSIVPGTGTGPFAQSVQKLIDKLQAEFDAKYPPDEIEP